jgi:hypothetical protein
VPAGADIGTAESGPCACAVQFETIHPFLDGNGRLGRLLITLLHCEHNVLRQPMLYLSLYFKTHRQHYYELAPDGRLGGHIISYARHGWSIRRCQPRGPHSPGVWHPFSGGGVSLLYMAVL